MAHGGLYPKLWCVLASLSLVVALPWSAAMQAEAEAKDGELIRLGVKRMAHNVEVERLVAKYESIKHQALAADKDHRKVPLMNMLHSLTTGIASKAWWLDQPTLALADAGGDGNQAVETKIRTGEGSHTISVYVAGQVRELIIDTGSGKTAFICEGCSKCGDKHRNKPFHMSSATKYATCDPNNLGDSDMGGCMSCQDSKCRYGQRYVEGDYWEAYKVSDVLSFSPPSSSNHFEARVDFGCIYEQTGCFNEQSSDGIMGFSRHPDSIHEQFYRAKVTPSRIFAQCLAADGGALTLGGVDMRVNKEPIMYTPLRDTGYQYWTVQLESVSIGQATLPIDKSVYNKDRGCVFDSGTTFLYLPNKVKAAFAQAWHQATGNDDSMPISESYHHMSDTEMAALPEICFHFANDAKICMAPDAYMFKLGEGEYAGTVYFGDEMRSTIIGASTLAHHNIIYDIDNYRIGIAKADCDAAAASAANMMMSAVATEQMIALELHPGGDKFIAAPSREFWTQVALASVAFCAMAGLVLTIWEELRLPAQKVNREEGKENVTVAAGTMDDATDFAFVLMEGDV